MPVAIVDPVNRTEPRPNFGFGVEIGGAVAGWFTECSGLTVEREVKPHPEGGVNDYIHQLPGRIKRFNLTLKHGLAAQELWQWFQQGLYDGQIEHRNVSVILYHQDLSEAQRWDLPNAYPAKWTGANFNSKTNEVMIETLELTCGSGGSGSSSSTISRAPATTTGSNNGPVAGPSSVTPSTSTDQEINLPALATKVYELLKQELRVEQERLGRRRFR